MSRTVQGMAIVSIIAWASAAVALGLGDIDVRSRLNQPLSARIAINAAATDNVSDLRIAVAGNAEFKRAGIEQIPYLASLKFAVKDDGAPYIEVSSDQPAREPFVTLLLDVRDGGNKIIREYSLFLDPAEYVAPESTDSSFYETATETSSPTAVTEAPPLAEPRAIAPEPAPATPMTTGADAPTYYAPSASESEANEAASASAPPVVTAPTAAPTVAAATPATASAEPIAAGTSYGPINNGETLWSIATRARPVGASMDQVLLAIFTGNPAAFDGGINGLRKGAVLQLPDAAAVMAVPAATAKEEVQRLRGLRSTGKTAAATPAVVDSLAVASAEPVPTAAPTAKPTAKPKPTAIPTAEATLAPTAEPTLEPTAEPTAVATAEATAAATPDAAAIGTGEASTDPAATADPSSTQITEALATTGSPADASGEALPTASATPSTEDIVVASVKKPRRAKESSLLETLLLPLIAGLAVLAGAYLLYRTIAKRKADGGFAQLGSGAIARPAPAPKSAEPVLKSGTSRQKLEDLDRELPRTPAAPAAQAPKAESFQTPAAEIGMATQRIQALQTETQQIQPPPAIKLANLPLEPAARTAGLGDITLADTKNDGLDFDLTGQFESQTMQINLDTNDPLSEADFHLAYGLFDEAALLLKQAIAREPSRPDLQIKLAETYFAAGKASEFEATAAALRPLVAASEWQKIAIMGQQLAPGSGQYGAGDSGSGGDAVDLDLGMSSTAEVAARPGDTGDLGFGDASIDTGSLDFKLDSFDEPQAARPVAAPAAAAAPAVESLEFDLGEFDLSAPPPASMAASSKPAAEFDDNMLDFDLEIGEPAKAAIEALDFESSKGNVDAGIAFDLGTSEVPKLSGRVVPDTATFGTQNIGTADPHPGSDDVGLDNVDLGDLDGGFAVGGGDDAATKLDLARAYVDMGDNEMARSLLGEVMQQGTDAQKQDATALLRMLG